MSYNVPLYYNFYFMVTYLNTFPRATVVLLYNYYTTLPTYFTISF